MHKKKYTKNQKIRKMQKNSENAVKFRIDSSCLMSFGFTLVIKICLKMLTNAEKFIKCRKLRIIEIDSSSAVITSKECTKLQKN
jgi:hypothetical protein